MVFPIHNSVEAVVISCSGRVSISIMMENAFECYCSEFL